MILRIIKDWPCFSFVQEASEGVGGSDLPPIQSLVVCPPTLTGHWVYEVQKFVDCKYLNPLHYTGPPVERYRLVSSSFCMFGLNVWMMMSNLFPILTWIFP